MSRAWMPIYWGDYLRDTGDLSTLQHGAYMLLIAHYWQFGSLPTNDRELAIIARVSPFVWRKIRPELSLKFTPTWSQKRIDKMIEKFDRKLAHWQYAGHKGGTKSGMNRTAYAGRRKLEGQANAEAYAEANAEAKSKQMLKQNPKQGSTILSKKDITNTSFVAAREEPGVDNPPAEPVVAKRLSDKKPNEMTKAELDQFYVERRARAAEVERERRAKVGAVAAARPDSGLPF